MACVGPRNHNSFSLLASLDPPKPVEWSQAIPQCNPIKNGVFPHSTPVVGKAQRNVDQHCDLQPPRNPYPHQNGNNKPRFAEGRNNFSRPPNQYCPPRFQNRPVQSGAVSQGLLCHPAPHGPCSTVIDPCLVATPTCTKGELINARLREQLAMLQKQPTSIARPVAPRPTSQVHVGAFGYETARDSPRVQPICAPLLPPKKDGSQPVPIPPRPDQRTVEEDKVVASSTPTQRIVARERSARAPEVVSRTPTQPVVAHERSSRAPEVVSRTPTEGTIAHDRPSHPPEVVSRTPAHASTAIDLPEKVDVNLPRPSRPSRTGDRERRHHNRRHTRTKHVDGERRLNQVEADRSFEVHNGPVVAKRVISPPPPDAAPSVVKLPASKDIQQAPRSPATTASSLSEDLSGGSSVLLSDTTFTSVDSNVSNVSNKVSQHHKTYPDTCRNWTKGFPCHYTPCPFRHPPRPDRSDNPATQPVQSLSVPPRSVGVVKTSSDTRDPKNNSTPRKQDPPSGVVKPPPKPEPLYATTISDHIKVRFDQGFKVQDVVTGFESRWAHLGNIANTVTSAALSEWLAPYKVDRVHLPESSEKPVTAKVQFASAEDAIKAVTDLNGVEFAQRTITAKLAINNSAHGSTVLTDTDAQLTWECPFRVGYAGYDTLKEAKIAIDSLNGFPMEYLVVSAQLYEGLPCIRAYNVIFKQLPASVTEEGLRKFAKSKSVMLGRPNYQSLTQAVDSIRSRLEEYGTVTSFDVLPPPYKDGMVKAWVRFTSPAEARAAQDDLDRRRPKATGHTTISCRHVVSLSHTLNPTSYRKMREDIGWLRWSWQRRYGPGVSIREKVKEENPDCPVYIRLSSERPELMSTLKYEFENLLHGETITLERKPLWDNFFVASAGQDYISRLHAQYPGVQIEVQNNRRVISLWGPIVIRHRARQDVVRKVMELKALQFEKIPLSGKLSGIFCSAELSTLRELLGAENCILDFSERALLVRGNDSAYRTACNAVQDARSRLGDEVSTSDAVCPVCFGEAVVPVTLACGHRWCRTCLTGYLTSAVENKMFPLRCLGNDAGCTELIPLGLSRKLLPASDFNAVVAAAFWVYVHGRPDEFHHCPTPDCTQVYRSAPPNAVLQCPSCLVRICPSCRIEYHDGMTCEERDVADDKLFNEWTTNHDVKSCPGCRAPIERSEGCNHMTCTRCQTHICWECMATFPRGEGIYDHMRVRHGSIGL